MLYNDQGAETNDAWKIESVDGVGLVGSAVVASGKFMEFIGKTAFAPSGILGAPLNLIPLEF